MLIILKWYWALFLFPLPWLFKWLMPVAQSGGSGLLRVPFFEGIYASAGRKNRSTHRFSRGYRLLLLLLWTLLVLAVAQPQHVGEPVSINPKARDLMLAVDTSGSMEMQDMRLKGQPVDRLTAIKAVVDEFVTRRKNDRVGLILFGTHAYLQTPLTFDRKTLQVLLNEAQIKIAGEHTAIGDAIGLALKKLTGHPSSSKVLILLTDGANTAGSVSPQQAAELAATQGMKIYTIGVGAEEIKMPGLFGFGTRTINPSADMDEGALKQIAKTTGGQYFRARDTDELRRIYQMLDKLEPVEANPETYRPIRNLFYLPLGSAFIITLLMAVYSLFRGFSEQRVARQIDRDVSVDSPSRKNIRKTEGATS